MRIAFAAALLAVASPAMAHPHQSVRLTPRQAAAALQNPLLQDAGARALTHLIGILLDTRVGPAGPLVAPDAHIRPDDTLRDLAQRDDPRFEEHFHHDSRQALAKAGAVAGGAAAQAVELKRTAKRLDAALTPLLDALASNN
ncbi:hypothetical protein M0208_06600 [Sphingomonas sp. SUN019]|uniref:hypothetical protein n=1 Tax=Sphingomonas sp. SUN019 TaxID=2937788 RepID=UPI002164362D|nr:hypothetical protein [Sphingomonas sp. SUN019]UVO50206.1 hypothetical protein M0208_06600 [Sphingomonas sp. SUN019]